ncbi:hypothetical protein N9C96_00810 [bacterium]|nr:hypothetical protein [bacterium]
MTLGNGPRQSSRQSIAKKMREGVRPQVLAREDGVIWIEAAHLILPKIHPLSPSTCGSTIEQMEHRGAHEYM